MKPPTDFDSTRWMIEHTVLVNRERESLENIGYDVHTGNQNLFHLRGATVTIGGKPDLMGEKSNEILISDAKTGHAEMDRLYQRPLHCNHCYPARAAMNQ